MEKERRGSIVRRKRRKPLAMVSGGLDKRKHWLTSSVSLSYLCLLVLFP